MEKGDPNISARDRIMGLKKKGPARQELNYLTLLRRVYKIIPTFYKPREIIKNQEGRGQQWLT